LLRSIHPLRGRMPSKASDIVSIAVRHERVQLNGRTPGHHPAVFTVALRTQFP
jgi:hypothetical protein